MKIDIVILHNGRDYLKTTLKYIWQRTNTPYRITIIDDGSTDKDYLIDLFKHKKINLFLTHQNNGIGAAVDKAIAIAQSKLFVLMSDDVLVPDINPDWISELSKDFGWCEDLGMLALNNPTSPKDNKQKLTETTNTVSVIDPYVAMINKDAIDFLNLPKESSDTATPISKIITEKGYRIGYLKNVYCQHIGIVSSFENLYPNKKFDPKTFIKVNPKTLKPEE